jgi:23S rRNA (uridine2552-2'-O)-methyltransferase
MEKFGRQGRGGGRGGFGGRGFGFREKPVKIGEEYDVEITDVGAKGDGIAKIKDFIIFVAGTKRGEKLHIRIKEVAQRFAVGERVSETPVE